MEQGFIFAFVTLTVRPNRRLGQQGGNPPRAAPSCMVYVRMAYTAMNKRAKIVANYRTRGTPADEAFTLIDDLPGADR